VNPFLSKNPEQKARRLARALVSDMIVYQPKKREEALEQGTIKEAFEEEIKKSWEEYVEQVGDDVAKSTPYFHEALNEILAGGQQVF
jgi:precorrin-2 methylase